MYGGFNMKKVLSSLLVASAALLLVGCGSSSNKTESSTSTSKTTASSSEIASGASQKQEFTAPKELKDSYDVIIVGAGGAGMSAAIQAKEAGANPVIFEKMPVE